MRLARCEKGHYYDKDKFSTCPHCNDMQIAPSETVAFEDPDAKKEPDVVVPETPEVPKVEVEERVLFSAATPVDEENKIIEDDFTKSDSSLSDDDLDEMVTIRLSEQEAVVSAALAGGEDTDISKMDTMAEKDFVAEEKAVEEEVPEVEVSLAAEEEPARAEIPSVEKESIIEETPIVEEESIKEDTSGLWEKPVREEFPSVEEESVREETPSVEQEPISEAASSLWEESIREESPAVEEESVREESPAVEEESVREESPTVEEESVREESPAVEEESVGEESPAVEEESVREESLAVGEEPLAEAAPPVWEESVKEESPVVEEEPPVVEEEPTTEAASALWGESVTENTSAKEEDIVREEDLAVEENAIEEETTVVEVEEENTTMEQSVAATAESKEETDTSQQSTLADAVPSRIPDDAILEEMNSNPVIGWLISIEGTHKGRSYNVKQGRNFVGRSTAMDICLSGNSKISRERHAIITYDPRTKKCYLQPDESRDLIYINDDLLFGPMTMKHNDVITMGEEQFVFLTLQCDKADWI